MYNSQFKFETVKETEKAIFCKVPYWVSTNDTKRKHKQKFFDCWIPKSILVKDDVEYIRYFVFSKIEERRTSNGYQKRFEKPNFEIKDHLGQYAPEKSIAYQEIDKYGSMERGIGLSNLDKEIRTDKAIVDCGGTLWKYIDDIVSGEEDNFSSFTMDELKSLNDRRIDLFSTKKIKIYI